MVLSVTGKWPLNERCHKTRKHINPCLTSISGEGMRYVRTIGLGKSSNQKWIGLPRNTELIFLMISADSRPCILTRITRGMIRIQQGDTYWITSQDMIHRNYRPLSKEPLTLYWQSNGIAGL